jgi:pimeloyl-ACP methyl ester carboxylesterase
VSTDLHVVGDGPTGVLVLSGSSGRVEGERCRVLAQAGATAASYRWFGAALDRLPLESFDEALATLHERCDRLVVMGTSRGAEAALVLGARHAEVDAVVAVSPSHVVWAALTDERPQRSSWTSGGEPLPFVPYDDSWVADTDPPEYAELYEHCLDRYADRVPAARIPVERISGEVVLVAGGDDRLWPSLDWSEEILWCRERHGLPTTLVSHPDAGHRVRLPGERPPAPSRLAHGGTPAADLELGERLWPTLLRLLGD